MICILSVRSSVEFRELKIIARNNINLNKTWIVCNDWAESPEKNRQIHIQCETIIGQGLFWEGLQRLWWRNETACCNKSDRKEDDSGWWIPDVWFVFRNFSNEKAA